IYTSGSTGKPKGVSMHCSGGYSLIRWAHSYLHINNLTRFLQSISICFDPSVNELFTPITYGGGVVIFAPPQYMSQGQSITSIITHWSVTAISLVPTALLMILPLLSPPVS